jgi:hypothetical protein
VAGILHGRAIGLDVLHQAALGDVGAVRRHKKKAVALDTGDAETRAGAEAQAHRPFQVMAALGQRDLELPKRPVGDDQGLVVKDFPAIHPVLLQTLPLWQLRRLGGGGGRQQGGKTRRGQRGGKEIFHLNLQKQRPPIPLYAIAYRFDPELNMNGTPSPSKLPQKPGFAWGWRKQHTRIAFQAFPIPWQNQENPFQSA